MAKPGKIPDFRKMYPEASEEIIEILKKSERKMQYQEFDLKSERIVKNQKAQEIVVLPSREISYDRMIEEIGDTISTEFDVESLILSKEWHEKLHEVLCKLDGSERYLIMQLFFVGRTERDLGVELGVSQKAINKRCHKILKKMRDKMENI